MAMSLAAWWHGVVHDNAAFAREVWHDVLANDWKSTFRPAFRLRYWYWWLFVAAFLACAILAAIFREDILLHVQPRRELILSTPFSWLVPIGILVAVEFPPLGGHSVTAIATGAIWGFKLGVPIVFADLLLGEVLCFLAFSTFLRKKAMRIEHEKPFHACLAESVRTAGLLDTICLRFSALPGRVVTAVAATIGIRFWVYLVALVVSLPRELVFIYAGALYTSDGSDATPALSIVLVAIACLTTIIALDIILLRAWRFSHGEEGDQELSTRGSTDFADNATKPTSTASSRGAPAVDRYSSSDRSSSGEGWSEPEQSSEDEKEWRRAASRRPSSCQGSASTPR